MSFQSNGTSVQLINKVNVNRYLVEITMLGQMIDCKYYQTIIRLFYVKC